jgi:hypothetical protein
MQREDNPCCLEYESRRTSLLWYTCGLLHRGVGNPGCNVLYMLEIRAGLAWGLFAIVCTFHLMRKY